MSKTLVALRAKVIAIPEEDVKAVVTALRTRAAILNVHLEGCMDNNVRNILEQNLVSIVKTADMLENEPIKGISFLS